MALTQAFLSVSGSLPPTILHAMEALRDSTAAPKSSPPCDTLLCTPSAATTPARLQLAQKEFMSPVPPSDLFRSALQSSSPLAQIFDNNATSTNQHPRQKNSSLKPPLPSPSRTPTSADRIQSSTPSPGHSRGPNGGEKLAFTPSPSNKSQAFVSPSGPRQIPASFSALKTPGSIPIIIQAENSPTISVKKRIEKSQDPEELASFFGARSAKMLSPLSDPQKLCTTNFASVDVNVNPLSETYEKASQLPADVPIETVLDVPFNTSYGFEQTYEVDLFYRAARVPIPYAINVNTLDVQGEIDPYQARLERDPDDIPSILLDFISPDVVFSPPEEDNEHRNDGCDIVSQACITFWAAPNAHLENGSDRFVLTVTGCDGQEYETKIEINVATTEPIIAVQSTKDTPDISLTETTICFPTGHNLSERNINIWNCTEGGAPLLLNVVMPDVESRVFCIGSNSSERSPCIPMYIPSGECCSFSARYEILPDETKLDEYYGFALVKLATVVPSAVDPDDDAELNHSYDHVVNFIGSGSNAVVADDHGIQRLSIRNDELQEHRFCATEAALHHAGLCALDEGVVPARCDSKDEQVNSEHSETDSFEAAFGGGESSEKEEKGNEVEVWPLPIQVSPSATEEVSGDLHRQSPSHSCHVSLHSSPKWVPTTDSESQPVVNVAPGQNSSQMKSESAKSSSDGTLVHQESTLVDEESKRNSTNSRKADANPGANPGNHRAESDSQSVETGPSDSRVEELQNLPNAPEALRKEPLPGPVEAGSEKSKLDAEGSTCEAEAAVSEGKQQYGDTDNSIMQAQSETLGLYSAVGNEMISPAADIKNGTFKHPQAESPPTSQDSSVQSSVLVQSANSKNGYSSSSEVSHLMENFERRGSPSAFATETEGSAKPSLLRGSYQSFGTAKSEQEARRLVHLKNKLFKSRKPKIKMPRSIRENGIRIEATAGSCVLPLFNSSTTSVTVAVEITKCAQSKTHATVSSEMLVLAPEERTDILISRTTCMENNLSVVIAAYVRGALKLSTVYHVPLFVEASKNMMPAAIGFAVDRPTISFYDKQSRYQSCRLRVLNGTDREVSFKVWIGGWDDSVDIGSDDDVFKITSPKSGVVRGEKCVTVEVRFDSSKVAQFFRRMLYIKMDNSTDKIPMFGYTGSSSIRFSTSKSGLLHAENLGTRCGFVALSGPEIDSEENLTEKFVLRPSEKREVVAPYGSGTIIYAGDEIARSRYIRALTFSSAGKLYGGDEMKLFVGRFEGEVEGKREEGLYWRQDTRHSLHYAGRLLGRNVRRYRFDPDKKRVVSDRRRNNDSEWHASIDEDGYVHIENYDTDRQLCFKCSGTDPCSGSIPPLGDAKLAAFADHVKISARGKVVEVFNG